MKFLATIVLSLALFVSVSECMTDIEASNLLAQFFVKNTATMKSLDGVTRKIDKNRGPIVSSTPAIVNHRNRQYTFEVTIFGEDGQVMPRKMTGIIEPTSAQIVE